MKRFLSLLLLASLAAPILRAQITMELEAGKQGFRHGVSWVKRSWYNPLPGTAEPDKSNLPNIYLRPNQLVEFNKEGKLRTVTEFQGGTDDEVAFTESYSWKDGRLMKRSRDNADYEVIYATTYTYDANGHEVKAETKAGPGDKMGIFAGMAGSEEHAWSAGRRTASTTRDRDGKVVRQVAFTYDAEGRVIREDYSPAGLYSARTYAYDAKGQLIQDTYLDGKGAPSTVHSFAYNAAGKPVKRTMSHFYAGKKDREETTTYTYNAQGDKTGEQTVKDGVVSWDYRWEHKYDAKGNRIQTAHIKAGKPEYIEVLNLLYHK